MKIFFTSFIYLLYLTLGTSQHSVERLPSPINTDLYDEICPVMSYSEDYLFYTKVGSPDFIKSLIEDGEDKNITLEKDAYDQKLKTIFSLISGRRVDDVVSSKYNQDIWYTPVIDGQLQYPVHPSYPINNALPNSICSNYNKENTFVVINEFEEGGGMAAGFSRVTLNKDGTFTFPTPIEIDKLRHNGSDINLAMSADAQHIFLSMKGPNTYGDRDLYVSIKAFQDIYSQPINLGPVVNSKFREATPYISQDKSKLYFASDRPGGIGGMDIYMCERLDYSYTNWTKPVLIGQPINSPADDSHPYIALDTDQIYFSTNRDGTSDIYRARLVRDTVLQAPIKVRLVAINGTTDKPMPAIINWGDAYEDGYDDFFNTRDGKLEYVFESNDPVKFMAENRAIKSDVKILDPIDLNREGIEEVDLMLVMTKSGDKKLIVRKRRKAEDLTPKLKGIEKELADNSKVLLKNIKFVRAKPDVLAESFPALEELASVLARRPDLKLRIEGHTDNVGDANLLQKLSQDRADAIKVILIARGADESQIETIGYGHTKPLNANRNETERQENRRVEIQILEQKSID